MCVCPRGGALGAPMGAGSSCLGVPPPPSSSPHTRAGPAPGIARVGEVPSGTRFSAPAPHRFTLGYPPPPRPCAGWARGTWLGDRDGVGGCKSPAPGVRGLSGAVFLFPLFPLGLWQQLAGGNTPLGVFPAWINPSGAGLQQHRVQGQAPTPSRWGKVCAFPGRGGAAGFEHPPPPRQPLNVSWVPLNPSTGDDSGCWAEPCQTHCMHQQCPRWHWERGKGFFLGGKGVLCSRRGQGRAGVGPLM